MVVVIPNKDKIKSVEVPNKLTIGATKREIYNKGKAINVAIPSGSLKAKRLGTNSPITRDK